MGSGRPFRASACIHWLILILLLYSSSATRADEHSLDVSQSTSLQLSRGGPVEKSPGSKPGTTVFCERVYIHGLQRLKNLQKIANTLKVKISPTNLSTHLKNVEVCFHRNMSLGIGMCPQGQWEKVSKDSWVQSMSPFDHKVLDIRTSGLSLDTILLSIEEGFFLYRVIFLILGIMTMSLASTLSKSLVFYYSSAMAVGVLLVVLMVLFQGMKLLPTGRRSSLAIVLYSSVVGLGSFLLRYVPGLLRSILLELGISEEMYYPLAMFLLAFVVLAGAWLGFWAVRKLILTEDGTIDISTSIFIAWAIRIFSGVLILQCSADPLLAGGALIVGIVISSLLRRTFKSLRRLFRDMTRTPKKNRRRSQASDTSPFEEYNDKYAKKFRSDEGLMFRSPQPRKFPLVSCSTPKQGYRRGRLSHSPGEEVFPSSFHATPEGRRFSKEEWGEFTKSSTEKALGELVSSPDFGKWLHANAERITVSPNTARAHQEKNWFYWF